MYVHLVLKLLERHNSVLILVQLVHVRLELRVQLSQNQHFQRKNHHFQRKNHHFQGKNHYILLKNHHLHVNTHLHQMPHLLRGR